MEKALNKLTNEDVKNALESEIGNLGWFLNDSNKLEKNWKFKNFKEAFSFMTKVALISESINHHPEWFNVYSNLKIELTSHDAGGISKLDIDFIKLVEGIE